MATKVEVQLSCDLPGKHTDGTKTRTFTIDDQDYELETCSKHGDQLNKVFAPFLANARKVQSRRKASRPPRTAASRNLSKDIRIWAKEQGIRLTDAGRIPTDVKQKYALTHKH